MRELEPAIRDVLAGKVYVSPAIADRLLKEGPRQQLNGGQPLEQLTARQREVLQLMAEGETTKGIAMILKLSNKTVEYHRAKLMECLNIFDVPGRALPCARAVTERTTKTTTDGTQRLRAPAERLFPFSSLVVETVVIFQAW